MFLNPVRFKEGPQRWHSSTYLNQARIPIIFQSFLNPRDASACRDLQNRVRGSKNGVNNLFASRASFFLSRNVLFFVSQKKTEKTKKVADLPEFLNQVLDRFPRLTDLSMMRNPACPGLMDIQRPDMEACRLYRTYVVFRAPQLVTVDGTDVTEEVPFPVFYCMEGFFFRGGRGPQMNHIFKRGSWTLSDFIADR